MRRIKLDGGGQPAPATPEMGIKRIEGEEEEDGEEEEVEEDDASQLFHVHVYLCTPVAILARDSVQYYYHRLHPFGTCFFTGYQRYIFSVISNIYGSSVCGRSRK